MTSIFSGYATILLSVAFLYLFICVDDEGSGPLSIAKRFFWKTVPKALKWLATKTCGKRFVWIIERIFRYICYEPNPIVQIVYFICAFGGFYIYITEGFIHLPNDRVSTIHIYIGSAIMILCYVSYFMACTVDPGRLDKDMEKKEWEIAVKRFKYDGIFFKRKEICRTCKYEKPSRSKHCSVCGVCV